MQGRLCRSHAKKCTATYYLTTKEQMKEETGVVVNKDDEDCGDELKESVLPHTSNEWRKWKYVLPTEKSTFLCIFLQGRTQPM